MSLGDVATEYFDGARQVEDKSSVSVNLHADKSENFLKNFIAAVNVD